MWGRECFMPGYFKLLKLVAAEFCTLWVLLVFKFYFKYLKIFLHQNHKILPFQLVQIRTLYQYMCVCLFILRANSVHYSNIRSLAIQLRVEWYMFWLTTRKTSGPRFNIKMTSYQYRKSHCGDKTILRPSYLHNGISFTGKTSLYWIGALGAVSIRKMVLPGMAIPMLKIRRPNGRLIFNMEITIRR